MDNKFINPFVKNKSEYTRDINVLQHYLNDSATYLNLMTGKSLEECKRFISTNLKRDGKFPFVDPKVECFIRKDNGDREKVTTTLNTYLTEVIKDKEIIAPTFTTYVNPSNLQSLLSIYIDANVKARSVAKKAMFAAEAAGDMNTYNVKKIEQTNKKLANNAISGAHVSPSNPFYNPTAHSTLTSNCRSTAGYGNANNEKLLSGNRHYWSHHIVLNNIVSIVAHSDYTKLANTMAKWNLVYPTVQDTMDCITYSTKLYWWETTFLKKIEDLVERLNPLQRAAFVYTGDLYHIKKLNNDFVKNFIGKLSKKITGTHPDPDKQIKEADEAHLNLAHQICTEETKGIGKKYTDIKDKPAYHTLALTVLNIETVITEYADMIKTFFVTNNLPASMAYFPESIRRSALTGDTDSTIFTVQDWVMWYKGCVSFDDEAISIAATMIFLSSATITHILAIMSANFGIEEKRLHQIEMKNEFKFDVFVPTQLGKHYFATIGCQEGNVFAKRKMEIKGVYLKSSNAPKIINTTAEAMMKEIMETVIRGEKISIMKYLKQVADIEREIIASIKRNEITYLRTGSIKDAASYTKEASLSPFQNHVFWNTVFGPDYGLMDNPPYPTMKISLTTDSTVKMKKWILSMPNRTFAQRLEKYLMENSKTNISTLNIPMQVLSTRGIPTEVVDVIDYRRIVTDIVKIFYLLLECLGFYSMEDKVQHLISDHY